MRHLLRSISAQLASYTRKSQGWENHLNIGKRVHGLTAPRPALLPLGMPCLWGSCGSSLAGSVLRDTSLLRSSRPLPLKLPQNNLVLPAVPLCKGWQGKGLGNNE